MSLLRAPSFALLIACSFLAVSSSARSEVTREHQAFAEFFEQVGTVGTMVVMDVHSGAVDVYNPERAAELFPPASTFKILNSLIALETGVVSDVDAQTLKWDGEVRARTEWNQDHSLRTAIAVSAFPTYQQIAQDIGLARMTDYLGRVGYGTGEITPETLRWFWVLESFRISAKEQTQFLKRLYLGDLPFSQRNMDAVKDITVVERGEGYVLHGKTGWTTATDPGTGWFVGWVEGGQGAHVFALNMDMTDENQAPARITIAKDVLKALGLL